MKAILFLSFTFAFALVGWPAELRIATVDLQRIMDGYHRAQQVVRELKSKEVSFLKELENLRLEGRKLAGETEKLRRLSLDNVLSATEREETQRSFELKLADLQTFGIRYDEIKAQREAELRAQASRMNKSVLDDVLAAMRRLGEKEDLNLILNASRGSPMASDVLFARSVEDVTEKVLALLNTTRPALPEAAPAKP
jgi:Skp family chaperone for outer membrane proteins